MSGLYDFGQLSRQPYVQFRAAEDAGGTGCNCAGFGPQNVNGCSHRKAATEPNPLIRQLVRAAGCPGFGDNGNESIPVPVAILEQFVGKCVPATAAATVHVRQRRRRCGHAAEDPTGVRRFLLLSIYAH